MPSPATTSDPEQPAPPWYRWLLLFGVWLLYGCFGLVVSSLAPLVPLIEADLGLSHAAMGTTMGAWQLVYIGSAIPCGILLDKLGPRPALTLGAVLIAASAYARGAADGFWELLGAVMLFGLGGPIISAGAPKVVTGWFTGASRGLAMGIYMTGPAIGAIASLTLTHSVLLPAFDQSWRAVLYLWAALGVAGALAWLVISAHPAQRAHQRQGGATPGLPQREILGRLLAQPAVLLVLAMGIGVFVFNHGLNNWLPELLRAGGMTLTEAGYWAAVPTVIGIGGALLIPRLATPGRRFTILVALSLCAAGASLLLHFRYEPLLFAGLFLQGVARSSLMAVLVLTLVELPGVGERYAGVASGLFFSAAEVGGVLGPLSLGVLYDLTGGFGAGLYTLAAIGGALALASRRLARLSGQQPMASSTGTAR